LTLLQTASILAILMKRPIVTFTTDFGLSDSYVAEMKASVLKENPDCTLIDVTHSIPPQDVVAGSITLQRAIAAFPPRSIHVAVVDPGVGTRRRLLIVKINRQRVLCPDNGLITWAWRMHEDAKAYELTWRPEQASETFHGRDIMGPVAGMLSRGKPTKALAQRIDDPMLLKIAPATSKRGEIMHIDRFGNAITNIVGTARTASVRAGRKTFGIHRTYSAVPRGKPVAVIGSSGLLEIAIRDGNAAKALGLRVGHEVVLQ
jgi:S-adenosylmethionine hydrolase